MTGRLLGIGLGVLAVLGVAAPAQAQAGDDVGFELGARVGYGVPIGEFSGEGTASISEMVSGQIPLWLDLGVRADRLFVGGYFQYGIGLLGGDIAEECEDLEDLADAAGNSAGCRVRDIRVGFQLHYHLGKPNQADPWLGAGFGYEWLTHSTWAEAGSQDVTIDVTAKGFELLNLQGGVDFLLGQSAAIGPFFTWTLSRFDKASISCSGECEDFSDQDQDIDEKAMHYWLIVGARFSFFP